MSRWYPYTLIQLYYTACHAERGHSVGTTWDHIMHQHSKSGLSHTE